mmetsp:Transcript_16355/g.17090  ORF Transcript_16355/g.17090 Transcript_16355/m.17090 type:complete len:214 (+) Transcript_16355:42-683(+)|eukprot:CAMPEP_0174825912 /NCGR_PEP_ID=MMETSP1107-20130205/43255_1 /TAXON_ID=36770 /ORGANISM="Paraphysomonas vestita, Strain GFlagA" /LENGTH=213 /DNA_ID=CAMNT_0016058041 /DNA_START=467 /DNA_END=1108 /DNA_ORIENTATION=-
MDDYLQFVVHLLDDNDYNPHILKKEMEDNFVDDLFNVQDYHGRERAFSWDLPLDDSIRKRSNSIVEITMSCFDHPMIEPPYKKQNIRMDLRDTVATVQLESGSGATTVMPVFTPDCDSMSVKIGAYTREERQILIEKFRAKKKRRVWRKQIKYDCRKRLADTRPRVKGRFVSRKEKDGNSDGDSESMNNAEAEIEIGPYDDHSVESFSSTSSS